MRRPSWASRRARRRLAALGLAALGLASAGCGAEGPPSDATLTVYVSAPLRGPSAADGRDVVRGAKLALREAGGAVGELEVRGVYLDDSAGSGVSAGWDPAQVAENARRATEDSTAIAYIGELESGATRTSLPITNEARLLQVSPASGATDLVEPFPGSGEVPPEAQPSGSRTFARVIPDDAAQAAAAARWVSEIGRRRAAVLAEPSEFGEALAGAFREAASEAGVRVSRARQPYGSATTGIVYVAGQPEFSHRATGVLAAADGVEVLVSDALLPVLRGLPFSDLESPPTRLTSAAQDPAQLPPAGHRFAADFRDAYGTEPGRYAAYGYEAMALVLDSIEQAGELGAERAAVIDELLATEDRDSILGTYSIDELGNTTLDRIAGYRLAGEGSVAFDRPLRVP